MPERRARIRARRDLARSLAASAVAALSAAGMRATVIGSLERPDFREDSDVDLLVDIAGEAYPAAFAACHGSFGDFPFDIVPLRDLGPGVADAMTAEAVGLVPFASVGRRIDGVRYGLCELLWALERLRPVGQAAGPVLEEGRIWSRIVGKAGLDMATRTAKLLRRVVLEAGGDLPPDADPSAVFRIATGPMPDGGAGPIRSGTATMLDAFADADDMSPTSRDATAVADAAREVAAGVVAAISDVEAFVRDRRGEASAPEG